VVALGWLDTAATACTCPERCLRRRLGPPPGGQQRAQRCRPRRPCACHPGLARAHTVCGPPREVAGSAGTARRIHGPHRGRGRRDARGAIL